MKKSVFHSFRQRLAAAFLVASLVPLLICSFSLVKITQLQMQTHTEESADEQMQGMDALLGALHDGILEVGQTLADSPLVHRALAGEGDIDTQVYDFLFTATAPYRTLGSFSLYDSQGICRYTTGGTPADTALSLNWGVLYAAVHADSLPVYQPCESKSQTAPLLLSAYPLCRSESEPDGFLVVEMNGSHFAELFGGAYDAQNEIMVLSEYWRLIYASQSGLSEELAARMRTDLLAGTKPGGKDTAFIYSVLHHPATGLYLLLRQPQMFTQSTLKMLYTASFSCALICILISVGMCLTLSRQIFSPVQKLQRAISQVSRDNLDVQIPADSTDELGQLAMDFNRMVSALKHNRQELVENQRELNQAQIRMLQAQLNPHFLCNTLDTMKWIGKINHLPQVALMSANLGDILRFCISPEEFVPLYREVAVLERYIEIQRIRLSDNFVFAVNLPAELSEYPVPKMILQPIVENAVIHGLGEVDSGSIRVDICREGENLRLSVTDNGCGFPPEMLGRQAWRRTEQAGHHLGLYNVNTILEKYYGQDSCLYLEYGPDGVGAKVHFTIPIREEEICHDENIGR